MNVNTEDYNNVQTSDNTREQQVRLEIRDLIFLKKRKKNPFQLWKKRFFGQVSLHSAVTEYKLKTEESTIEQHLKAAAVTTCSYSWLDRY